MTANFGGTEMRSALEKVFKSRCAQLPTSCFVLTDGEVTSLICLSIQLRLTSLSSPGTPKT